MSFQTNWVESSTPYSAARPASLSELSANKTTSKIDKCLWICVSVCVSVCWVHQWICIRIRSEYETESWARTHSEGSANQIKYNTNIYLPSQNTVRKGKQRGAWMYLADTFTGSEPTRFVVLCWHSSIQFVLASSKVNATQRERSLQHFASLHSMSTSSRGCKWSA